MVIQLIFSFMLGYFFGSVLPAYFLTQMIKGTDIREIGTGNAGTTNVFKNVGVFPSILTALFDLTKGLVILFFCINILNFPEPISFIGAFAAILGHVYPFYLGFHGGRGVATATGLLLFYLERLISTVSLKELTLEFTLILVVIFATLYITREENLLAIVVIPFFSVLLLLNFYSNPHVYYLLICNIYIFTLSSLNINKYNILGLKGENLIFWRVFIRPAAVLFPLLSYVISHDALILLIGIVLTISVSFDVLRLYVSKFASFFERHFSKIYKKAEKKKISSITGFLLGFFLTFFLFSREIAITAVFFSIFGDMAAKFSGMLFAKKKSYNKSLEGTAGFFTSAFICVYFLSYFGVIDFFHALIGASIATVVELLPLNIDDNISVPVISAFVMSLLI